MPDNERATLRFRLPLSPTKDLERAGETVDAVTYSRLKLLSCAIESAFAAIDTNEVKALLAERQEVLDELGPEARLTPEQSRDLAEIESRIAWQVQQTRAHFQTAFRRASRSKTVVKAYAGIGLSKFERAG